MNINVKQVEDTYKQTKEWFANRGKKIDIKQIDGTKQRIKDFWNGVKDNLKILGIAIIMVTLIFLVVTSLKNNSVQNAYESYLQSQIKIDFYARQIANEVSNMQEQKTKFVNIPLDNEKTTPAFILNSVQTKITKDYSEINK